MTDKHTTTETEETMTTDVQPKLDPATKVYRPGSKGAKIVAYVEGLNGETPTRKEIAEATGQTYYLVTAYVSRLRDYPGVPQDLADKARAILTLKNGQPSRAKQVAPTVAPDVEPERDPSTLKPKEAYEEAERLIAEHIKPSDALVAKANAYAKRARKPLIAG